MKRNVLSRRNTGSVAMRMILDFLKFKLGSNALRAFQSSPFRIYTPSSTFLPFVVTEVFNGEAVQCPRHSRLDVCDGPKMASFQVRLDAREQIEVTRGQVWTVRWLRKYWIYRQRSVDRHMVVVKDPGVLDLWADAHDPFS